MERIPFLTLLKVQLSFLVPFDLNFLIWTIIWVFFVPFLALLSVLTVLKEEPKINFRSDRQVQIKRAEKVSWICNRGKIRGILSHVWDWLANICSLFSDLHRHVKPHSFHRNKRQISTASSFKSGWLMSPTSALGALKFSETEREKNERLPN
jgi:hypothetical protein